MVVEVTLFPIPVSFAEIARFRSDASLYVSPDLNLVPLRSIIASAHGPEAIGASVLARNWLGNLLLLLPLGVMAPLIWSRFRNLWQATLLFVAVSLSIELAQYIGSFYIFGIRWKSADVDDLIVNVAGALLGFLLTKLLIRVWRALGNSTTE
jgi:glycopeptide antibiotics resistance protein